MIGLILLWPTSGWSVEPLPFSATYQSSYGMLSATGVRQLSAREDGSWLLENRAKLLMVEVLEQSIFAATKDGIRPYTYDFVNPLKKERSLSLQFDWEQHKVTDTLSRESVALPERTYDKLSYQLQLQLDVCAAPDAFKGENYVVADRGRLKTYRVEPVGREPMKTPVGTLETIKLRQFRPDKHQKETLIWVAPDWQCLLVRVEQHDEGDRSSLSLVKATVNGAAVRGTR
jgi:hypothetical protein